MMFVVRSGIPSLDAMFHSGNPRGERGSEESGIYLAAAGDTTSLCIAGPDGTGKSVMAMHYASRYMADARHFCAGRNLAEPVAFYISSDLSFSRAEGMWQNFALDRPNARKIPFRYPQMLHAAPPWWLGGTAYADDKLVLQPIEPAQSDNLATFVLREKAPRIAFVDLASHTAGDDWGFLELVLASLPIPEPEAPRHLLILDAMEGMETFAGDLDGFGQQTTRRGRIAKLIRLAAPKCHLVLVIEEPEEGTRLPEQFVADIVLRLRATEQNGYSRRTIEIEKARGQSHVRGRHPYVIRDGRGSTTGEQVNADDPEVRMTDGRYQGYLDVLPSLHSITRSIMQTQGTGRLSRSPLRAGFGIDALDELLAARDSNDPRFQGLDRDGQDPRGLPCGSISALIGDANTQKSFLGLAYLGQVFHDLAMRITMLGARFPSKKGLASASWSRADCDAKTSPARGHYVRQLVISENRARSVGPKVSPAVRRWAALIEREGRGKAGAAVLISTRDENARTLVGRFMEQLQHAIESQAHSRDAAQIAEIWADENFKIAFAAYLESRTVCRRLGIHDIPPPVLFHSIQRSVQAAQQVIAWDYADPCACPAPASLAADRAAEGWRIRFVLDDFNSVMRTYGRVHDDPLFLPFLLHSLRREGLSTLLIETQSGKHGSPPLELREDAQSDLRALSDYRIYTWHVPDFFGDHRIAIAAIPPMVQQDGKSAVLVRELEWYEPNSKTLPRVNPRFELYAGLETEKPQLVPLRVHLYAETQAWTSYIDRLDELWQRVFDPPALESVLESGRVVIAEKAENYELMREAFGLYANTNLGYSLVVQVDEYWRQQGTFRSQVDYLKRRPDNSNDPAIRASSFDRETYGLPDESSHPDACPLLDRIPFVWDFGFLAYRERLWEGALRARTAGEKDRATRKKRGAVAVWKWITGVSQKTCTWKELLQAASYVAEWESARQSRKVPAFDLAMVAPQTFSCLVLEMWFSEIIENKKEPLAKKLAKAVSRKNWTDSSSEVSLSHLVEQFTDELYCTWLLLAESLDLNAFGRRDEGFGFGSGRGADPNAIVTRHWYKSAAMAAESDGADRGPLRFSRLPGSFSVRGDWFLAAVRGSRSDRLADRALDLLSTKDAAVERLLRGIGLPVQPISDDMTKLSTRLRGLHGATKEPSTFTYEDLLKLGVHEDSKHPLHWLWRGNLKNYFAAAPVWERWLYRVLRRWQKTREHFASDWESGFDLHARVKMKEPISVVSYGDFHQRCELLVKELEVVGA